MSYHVSVEDAVRSAATLIRAGAEAVKLEGGRKRLPVVEALLEAEMPVMGHVGLTPQSVHAMGGFRVQAKEQGGGPTPDRRRQGAGQHAGCFAIVLEGVPSEVAAMVTRGVDVPTIGIGAGPDCDGQVLVLHDLLGLEDRLSPKFVRKYASLADDVLAALTAFAEDVRSARSPSRRRATTSPTTSPRPSASTPAECSPERLAGFGAICSALALVVVACGNTSTRQVPSTFSEESLRITAPGGQVREVEVFVADTPEERGRGLTGVEDLEGRAGLLFVWDSETFGGFHMFGTPMPLSIAWADAQGPSSTPPTWSRASRSRAVLPVTTAFQCAVEKVPQGVSWTWAWWRAVGWSGSASGHCHGCAAQSGQWASAPPCLTAATEPCPRSGPTQRRVRGGDASVQAYELMIIFGRDLEEAAISPSSTRSASWSRSRLGRSRPPTCGAGDASPTRSITRTKATTWSSSSSPRAGT